RSPLAVTFGDAVDPSAEREERRPAEGGQIARRQAGLRQGQIRSPMTSERVIGSAYPGARASGGIGSHTAVSRPGVALDAVPSSGSLPPPGPGSIGSGSGWPTIGPSGRPES